MHARMEGFDLHARLVIATQAAGGKRRLEDLVRYCARPPLSHDRVTMLDNGQISLELKTPWRDGTTHVVHDPLDFIAKLAALIPRPHKNLVLYHGVLAARSKLRGLQVFGLTGATVVEDVFGGTRVRQALLHPPAEAAGLKQSSRDALAHQDHAGLENRRRRRSSA